MPRGKPLVYAVGHVVGRLRVIAPPETGSRGQGRIYPCRCECGAEKRVRAYDLRTGMVRSCGCLRTDNMRALSTQPKTAEQKAKMRASALAIHARRRRLKEALQVEVEAEREEAAPRPRTLRADPDAALDLAKALGLA